jgi:hypothetical protein
MFETRPRFSRKPKSVQGYGPLVLRLASYHVKISEGVSHMPVDRHTAFRAGPVVGVCRTFQEQPSQELAPHKVAAIVVASVVESCNLLVQSRTAPAATSSTQLA